MACRWQHWFSLQILTLAIIQTPTDAYISVNLAFHCLPEGPPSVLRLQSKGPRSALFVDLNVRSPYISTRDQQTDATRCRLEVMAPPGHELTVHLDHPKKTLPSRSSEERQVTAPLGHELTVHLDHPKKTFPSRSSEDRQGFLPCFLRLSHTSKASDYIATLHKVGSRTVDLCDGSEMTVDTLFLTNHLTLTWSPPDASLSGKMMAKRLVITAISRHLDVCSNRHRFICLGRGIYFPVCISSELACDGHKNCPAAGDDENPEECEAMALKGRLLLADLDSSEEGHQSNPHNVIEAMLKKAVLKTLTEVKSGKRDATSTTTSQPGLMTLMFRDVSDIILKKLLNNSKRDQLAEPRNSTAITTTTKPPWQDSPEDPTLPAALAHYGPWGYLMLGMLICGAILMLCGLWECCCRSSKHQLPAGGPASTSAATTVFIINSAGGIGSHSRNSSQQPDEASSTPGPPSYEELDQPPPYNSLFPVMKTSNVEPLTIEENRVISGQHI